MSAKVWTHNICGKCWNLKHPEREPYRVKLHRESDIFGTDKCCFCANDNDDGIYVRHEPHELKCYTGRETNHD